MNLYWVQWKQYSADYNPINGNNPYPSVLAWWQTGVYKDFNRIGAFIYTHSHKDLVYSIQQEWPEFKEEYFMSISIVQGQVKYNECFFLSGWRLERMLPFMER